MRLRLATAEDRDFLLQVYASTRADELALTRWDSAACEAFVRQQFDAQDHHYRLHHPRSLLQVIVDTSGAVPRDVGRLWTDDSSGEAVHVLDISLLADARGQGLGTQCLQALRDQAHAQGRALTIHVEVHNPAQRLYRRLGFVACGAPQGLYLKMACSPVQALNTV